MSVETPVNRRQTGVVFMVLALAAMATKSLAATKEEYYNLTNHLFKGYRNDVRPVFDQSKSMEVHIGFHLYSVLSMNEQEQTMTTNAMLKINWTDDYLSWKKGEFGDIGSILVTQNSVWLPEIVGGNTLTSKSQLGYNNLQVRIHSDGNIQWLPTGVFETSCNFDISYYPFDSQVCSVELTSAVSMERQLTIYIDKTNPIDLTRFAQNGIWEVVSTSASNKKTQDFRTRISFRLQLKRRPTFYVLNVILPVVLMAMTPSLVFALPAESGEKMSLSIAVLLGFAVFLTLVTDSIPKTSVKVSVLMVYVIQLMALTTLSVILSVPLIKLHHRSSDKPLGTNATKVIVLLRKVMCMSADQRLCKVAEAKTSSQNGGRVSIVSEHTHNVIAPCGNSYHNDCRSLSGSSTKRSREVNPVSGEVASETISMFLFYIFFLYIIVLTVVYIVILITGGTIQEESTRLT